MVIINFNNVKYINNISNIPIDIKNANIPNIIYFNEVIF